MIYNVIPGTFNNYGIRNGDLICIINFVQWFRKKQNNPKIQVYLSPGVLVDQDYVTKFYEFIAKQSDCFSRVPGKQQLPYHELMLWDFRDITGDHATVHNTEHMKKKVVVFPIYDAEYHNYRNWTQKLINEVLEEYSAKYPDHEKWLCAKDKPPSDLNLRGFEVSTGFYDNIYHIMEAEVFVGGDTGTSHFAAALDPGPKELIYYYNGRGMLHTLPFHVLNGKGILKRFWQNCYSTTYKGQLVL